MKHEEARASGPMGRCLILNAVAAALIDHHLRERSQNLLMLPQTLTRIIGLNGMRMNRNGDPYLPITNVDGMSEGGPTRVQTRFQLDSGESLHMPALLGSLRQDDDGDIVLTPYEMMIGSPTLYSAINGEVRLITTRTMATGVMAAALGQPLPTDQPRTR